jgi:asparagine synthase (glutamine-hydrolysing)
LCGIAGFTHIDAAAEPGRIQNVLATLIHRGPDQQGCFETGLVSFGATRLKIIDLEGGDQPIVSHSGDVVIAFNGEIYNHQELRAELEAKGHRFRSHTDTETVLQSFIEWDADCFSRLRGMFAIALWTESRKRLILARDRVGIKPLYIARHGRDILFGSEIKSILVHPEVDRELSLAGLDCYLALNYVPCPWTLIDGIEKLPPGHWLEWKAGHIRSEHFWQLPLGQNAPHSLGSATEQLDLLLQQSVREHLVSDVPLGVWLSGGIDSSTILHYAANASSTPLRTFSISFEGRSFDEGNYIRQVASFYGTQHEMLNLTEDSGLGDAIEEFAYYSDEPNADAGALPVWFLSKLTRGGATVALSGEGADELFGGYVTYRADQLSARFRRIPRMLLHLAIAACRRWPVSDEKISFEYKVKRFLAGCEMTAERAHVYWNGTFCDRDKQELIRSELPPALASKLAEVRLAGNGLKEFLWFDQKYFLGDDILAKVDRISMAHSLEVRPPFLDHRIIEFASSLPEEFQVNGSRQKVILKELMKGKLPDGILRRKKVGFDIPAHEWLRGPLRSLMLDTLLTGASDFQDLFRPQAIQKLIARHLERRENVGYHLWGLMILFLWMKRWKIQTASSERVDQRVREGLFTSI